MQFEGSYSSVSGVEQVCSANCPTQQHVLAHAHTRSLSGLFATDGGCRCIPHAAFAPFFFPLCHLESVGLRWTRQEARVYELNLRSGDLENAKFQLLDSAMTSGIP